MYLVRETPINFTFSDDSVFLKKNLGGVHKFSEFADSNFFSCDVVAFTWLSHLLFAHLLCSLAGCYFEMGIVLLDPNV